MKNLEILDQGKLPIHVAIIMDGNGRWAKQRGIPRVVGHQEGIKRAREITQLAREIGIKVLTIYAFSYENWQRPKEEVFFLMHLLKTYLEDEWENMLKHNIQLQVIGDLRPLPKDIYEVLEKAIKGTAKCQGMILNLALSYGSRQEIIHAARTLAEAVREEKVNPKEINEELFNGYLWTKGLPDPDFIIRTSGELRLSNFLLWQSAYSELYVTPILWPDFHQANFIEALKDYQCRERRVGKISEQL